MNNKVQNNRLLIPVGEIDKEVELDIKKAAEALVNDYIYFGDTKYVETGRTYFYPEVVIHYEYVDSSNELHELRACINITSLIDYSMDSCTSELIGRLLAKSFDGLGIPRKKIAEYLDINQSTLSYILNKSMFRHRKIKN